ncbi:hypothetical protein GCM10009721_39150 [Terrabacter tumescens]|uniref:Restriction endonuclease type IV Mrr domain-containing protein n=1 Tax=Terrabacter tumescens TaxID=60443 RepID=A0ABQ2IEM8_9MICO|nr:restriction endonuclease [Terrabacter tumescens]GGN07634.1 hypothetical protein GCM10009721_39150 [Terrabacter tumescens]
MLQDVVGTFLDTLTEREFDGPLLALLAARGFTDVHFIHGQFEFGKDVVAKRADPETGLVRQYLIQSKAGDLGSAEWRAVRPQLEECEYNTLGHQSFDKDLPRVAVLVTTGRLKGSAPSDAAEYRKSVERRGLADLEIWERSDLVDWFCKEPTAGVAGADVEVQLLSMVTSILDRGVTDSRIEKYTRRWLPPVGNAKRAAVEAAILVNALTRVRRLDLAVSVALQLVRAACQDPAAPTGLVEAAHRLVLLMAKQVREQLVPLLEDPLDLARHTMSQMAIFTYPVICCRASEAIALGLALARAEGDKDEAAAFEEALAALAEQPGTSRPPSDLFTTSVILTTVMLSTFGHDDAVEYLRRVAGWLLDRHDDDFSGLGLASLAEDEATSASRVLGGMLESTTIDRRSSSYLATAVLDLAVFLGEESFYERVRENVEALRIVPETMNADEAKAHWVRGGNDVWPQPRVDFAPWADQGTAPLATANTDPLSALLLTAACRSRHYPGGWGYLAETDKH